ncbi:MAG: DUF1800 domain-containing protein [Dehalococcoidia bacterium]|nr:DUF1800 domain-containing protein [Dehalococcoidia bacterium]
MASREDLALMAHLMRRAGFGASYDELERRVAKGYGATVEELLYPEQQPEVQMDLMLRYMAGWRDMQSIMANQGYWTYRMVNSPRQLEEKMCLFWHGIFCVGDSKCMAANQILVQLNKFRTHGFGNFAHLLLQLATDPAMLYYLDNQLSHKDAVNENWGRELLELFAMGVGMDGQPNYSEDDVKACAQAFTGWTIANAIPRYPYGRHDNQFLYNKYDHNDSVKTFQGESGQFNGEDIIRIIAKQPSTARFVSRHLYNYFVADEPQVPAWQNAEPRDPAAIKTLEEEYFRSGYDIRSMLRVLFNSDFFKDARFTKVKSPAEVVAGTLRLVGDFTQPKPRLYDSALEIRYMGQDLLNPPTVEGWHTGAEWIDSGTLVERINFMAGEMGKVQAPGIQAIVQRLCAEGATISTERLLAGCLEMLGGYELTPENRTLLLSHVQAGGPLRTGGEGFAPRVAQILQLIVSTQEYQLT